MSYNRAEREAHLETLLEEMTSDLDPLHKALTIIKVFREACEEDEEWVIECEPDRYRIVRRVPR
jgi:hypothetical protein